VRLFIAIEIPGDIRNEIASFLKEIRGIAPEAKWVRAENLHVTLKFLGETNAARIGSIERALGSIRSAKPVTMAFGSLGYFPNEKRARVLWVGMEASQNLKVLAEDIDRALHQLGFPLEARPFMPHLTLARLDSPGLPQRLASAVNAHASRSFGSLATKELHLIESKLKSTGAEYTTVKSFCFVVET
jgi:2'-5' RNA ligase